MPDLQFQIEGAEVEPFAVSPQLAFKLRITNPAADELIHSVALRAQVQIESTRRKYSCTGAEPACAISSTCLSAGDKHCAHFCGRTPAPLFLLSRAATEVRLLVPCSFDFNTAATKYFAGLTDGEVPVCMQFSGSVFYAHEDGPLQVVPISWDKEVHFRLPVKLWKELMDTYYPGIAWLCLERDAFERLYRYKVERGIPTWEQALDSLLRSVEAEVKR